MSMSDEAVEALRESGIFPGPTGGELTFWENEPEPSREPDLCWIPKGSSGLPGSSAP